MSVSKDDKKTVEFIASLPIIGKQPTTEKEENFLREICEFEFTNLEEPGVFHRFPYGNTKRNHTFNLFHGSVYKFPRFIARHIESCATPLWDWRPDGTGKLDKKYMGKKPRFQMRQVFGD